MAGNGNGGGSGMPEQLLRYWSTGAGGDSINWGNDGDFDRCRQALSKYVDDSMLDGLCANLHQLATGAPPGHAPGESKDKG